MAGQYNAMLKSHSNHYLKELFDSSPGFNDLTMLLKSQRLALTSRGFLTVFGLI